MSFQEEASQHKELTKGVTLARDCISRIRTLVESGEEYHKLYSTIAELAVSLPEIDACAIYLPADVKDGPYQSSLAAHAGGTEIPEPGASSSEKVARRAVHGESRAYQRNRDSVIQYTDIVCLGAPMGSLGIATSGELSPEVENCLSDFAYFTGVVFERQRLSARLRHYMDRLEVLNELNQLIASNVGLEKISRALAREVAFRFAADCSLTLLISDDGKSLQLQGSYGASPDIIPESLPVQKTILGQVLRLGGIVSVPDLRQHADNGLGFLEQIGVSCIHCSSIEVRGETFGAMIIGFRKQIMLSEHDSSMFEEFARGAAVAIANARSQERLALYTEELEKLVERRTADLAIQTARAEEANRAKSRFVANMSHELRTPLTAIIGYSSVLAEGVFGEINEKQKEALMAITRSCEHLKDLIDDVLNISRIESGKEQPEPKKLDLLPLLDQVFRLMLQTAIGKSVKLIPISTPNIIKGTQLWVDPRHIRQALINLMSNAVKYTPSGGSVSLGVEIMGDKAKICVQDTGVGISPTQIGKIFERFERGDDSYSKKQVGTGIGLSLTKHLIELNGGKIGVESEIGKGSTFWLLIPLADPQLVTDDSATNHTESQSLKSLQWRLDGLNVLVVDDSKSTCEVLQTIIQQAGGTAHIAYCVSDAKKLAHKVPIDAALIDLAIPGESGIDLLEYFRKHCEEPYSTMPLIVVSACAFQADQEQALQHGASFFISKPFRPSEILQTIRHLTTASAINTSSGIS